MPATRMDKNSGAYKSRKFILTIMGLLLVTAVAAAGLFFPAVPAIYPTFIGGILGVLSLYFTGNVMSKHVNMNGEAKLAQAQKQSITDDRNI